MATNLRIVETLGTLGTLAVLLAFGVSCGGGDPMTQTEFCAEKATKECDGVAAACLSDPAACKARRVTACEEFAAAQQAAPSSPLLRPFRPDRASACVSKAAEVYKKSPITPADRAALDDVCARVFAGSNKGVDAPCDNDYECDGGQICDAQYKICAKKTTVSANGGCNNPGEVCPADQFCGTASPRKCVPRLTADMACDPTNPCASTLRCAEGVCAKRLNRGDACTSDSDCAPSDPYCDTFNGSRCTVGFIPSTGSNECVEAFGGQP
jgi:hypothetical protein